MAFDQTTAALATLGNTIAAVVPVMTAAEAAEANLTQLDASLASQITQLNGQLTPFVPAPAPAAADPNAPTS
jgi:hypothetical protein